MAMSFLEARPWLAHYTDGVPATVDVPEQPVTAALDDAARRWPNRIALDFFGATTTYAQLHEQAERASAALWELGVRPGHRLALVLPNCATHVVAFFGALRLGAVVVEHNPTYTADELAHQLADSGATVALVWTKAVAAVIEAQPRTGVEHVVAVDLARDLPTRSRLALRLPIAKARTLRESMCAPVPPGIPLWHELTADPAPRPDSPAPTADDIALLQYTGGTTGVPKGAVLTHRNLVANTVQGNAWVRFREGADTVYGVLPFFHAFGLTLCLTLPALIGATLVIFPKFDPAAFIAAQRRRPATFLPAVAPMLDRIVDAAADRHCALSSIRLSFLGAMPVTAETAARWEEATGGLLIEGYGMTECSPVALGNPCSPDRRPGTLGLPFPSTDIRVVDADDPTQDIEPDENGVLHGELLIRGPQVFQGYWNQPEETAGQLLDGGWLRTGDIVAVDPSGNATLIDRIKEMIITGGFKVYPSQVEDHLRGMPGVRDVAVVGLPGRGSDEHVAAVVVLDEAPTDQEGSWTPLSLESVRAWGEKRLARYALPRSVTFVSELPRSQIGKVMRRTVRADLLRTEAS